MGGANLYNGNYALRSRWLNPAAMAEPRTVS
jgi:hypothetical protein